MATVTVVIATADKSTTTVSGAARSTASRMRRFTVRTLAV